MKSETHQGYKKWQNGWCMGVLVVWSLELGLWEDAFGRWGMDKVSSIRIITTPKLTVKVVFPSVAFKIFSGSRDSIAKEKRVLYGKSTKKKRINLQSQPTALFPVNVGWCINQRNNDGGVRQGGHYSQTRGRMSRGRNGKCKEKKGESEREKKRENE